MKKYYVLFYQYAKKNGKSGIGRCPLEINRGQLKLDVIENAIKKKMKFKLLIITNFIKISKKMYIENGWGKK